MGTKKKAKPEDPGHRVVAQNRKARHLYHIDDTLEAGLVLQGTEVKSIRAGKVSIAESFVKVLGGEVWVLGMHIAEYADGSFFNHDTKRKRKLLLQKKQIRKLARQLEQKGMTAVPLEIYFNERGLAKIKLGLARGKRSFDRREDIKKRDLDREMRSSYKR